MDKIREKILNDTSTSILELYNKHKGAKDIIDEFNKHNIDLFECIKQNIVGILNKLDLENIIDLSN